MLDTETISMFAKPTLVWKLNSKIFTAIVRVMNSWDFCLFLPLLKT